MAIYKKRIQDACGYVLLLIVKVNLAKFYDAVWSPWGNEITVQLLLEICVTSIIGF